MRRRHGRMRECARSLAGPHRRVDPALVEEALGDAGHLRRERAVGGEHRGLRFRPADAAARRLRQRRIAVPGRQPLLAEPFGLERIIAMRQPRIGAAHRRDQRINHFGLDAVGEMARRRDVVEAAPAVGDFLVLGERVGDQRERAQIFLEGFRQRIRGGLAFACRRILQQVQRRLDGERLTVDLETQIRNRAVEHPVPGGIGRHGFFVEQLLDAIFKLVRLLLAHVIEPRPVMAERRIGHRRFEYCVVDAIEFEREEQKMRRGRGHALLHVAEKFRARWIDRVAGMDQAGVRHQPPDEIVDRLATPHRLGERCAPLRRARHGVELAFVGLLETDAVGVGAIKIALDGRIVEAGIEIVEIPFGQRPKRCLRAGSAALRRPPGGNFPGTEHAIFCPHLALMWRRRRTIARPQAVAGKRGPVNFRYLTAL